MFFNYVCELKTTSNMAGTMVFGDLLQNCVNQRLFETYNAPEYERIQMLHKLSGLYSEAYENTALFFGKNPWKSASSAFRAATRTISCSTP